MGPQSSSNPLILGLYITPLLYSTNRTTIKEIASSGSYTWPFFLLKRPGECSMTSGDPHPFRWCGIQLYMGQLQLNVFGAKASQLRVAHWSGMTFTVQKSGVPGEIVGHACRSALHACPVVGLAELCLLIRNHRAPHDAPYRRKHKLGRASCFLL